MAEHPLVRDEAEFFTPGWQFRDSTCCPWKMIKVYRSHPTTKRYIAASIVRHSVLLLDEWASSGSGISDCDLLNLHVLKGISVGFGLDVTSPYMPILSMPVQREITEVSGSSSEDRGEVE